MKKRMQVCDKDIFEAVLTDYFNDHHNGKYADKIINNFYDSSYQLAFLDILEKVVLPKHQQKHHDIILCALNYLRNSEVFKDLSARSVKDLLRIILRYDQPNLDEQLRTLLNDRQSRAQSAIRRMTNLFVRSKNTPTIDFFNELAIKVAQLENNTNPFINLYVFVNNVLGNFDSNYDQAALYEWFVAFHQAVIVNYEHDKVCALLSSLPSCTRSMGSMIEAKLANPAQLNPLLKYANACSQELRNTDSRDKQTYSVFLGEQSKTRIDSETRTLLTELSILSESELEMSTFKFGK